jgi:hypothetical protein
MIARAVVDIVVDFLDIALVKLSERIAVAAPRQIDQVNILEALELLTPLKQSFT